MHAETSTLHADDYVELPQSRGACYMGSLDTPSLDTPISRGIHSIHHVEPTSLLTLVIRVKIDLPEVTQ